MNYKELNGKSIAEGFKDFHEKNPHIYEAFESTVKKHLKQGRRKLSAKEIVNFIRWNGGFFKNDVDFKINDAYQSYYARLFVELNPDHKDVFSFRKLRNEESGPYMEVDEHGQLKFF